MGFKVRKDLEASWYKLWIAIELNLSSCMQKALSTSNSRAISINLISFGGECESFVGLIHGREQSDDDDDDEDGDGSSSSASK